jgi:hypothetical protein
MAGSIAARREKGEGRREKGEGRRSTRGVFDRIDKIGKVKGLCILPIIHRLRRG